VGIVRFGHRHCGRLVYTGLGKIHYKILHFYLAAPAALTPPRPGHRRIPAESSTGGGVYAPCQPPRTAAGVPTSALCSAPAGADESAMSAPTSPSPRDPRQLRLPWRPTCSPLRSNNRRNRPIHSRPVPIKWSARRDTPADGAGIGPQAAGPPRRQARAP
jgi:hypothetical protein